MIADAQAANIVAIDKAARKRSGVRQPTGVARVLHDGGAK
jgi:hypothetical protein